MRSLVCHDMMGGYLEDRFLAGCEGAGAEYTFRHWALVDVWVYFSHHFVTIPQESAYTNYFPTFTCLQACEGCVDDIQFQFVY